MALLDEIRNQAADKAGEEKQYLTTMTMTYFSSARYEQLRRGRGWHGVDK